MNPGICYVYEYENNQCKRNAGFLKITRHYQSCILQLHIRGLSLENGTSLELCAFYLSGSDIIGLPVASLTCLSRSISARLPVSESHFPEHRSLSGIDGFLIRLPGDPASVFWAASEKNFNADPAHMHLAGLPEETPAEPRPAESPDEKTEPPQENSLPEETPSDGESSALPDTPDSSGSTAPPPEKKPEEDSGLSNASGQNRPVCGQDRKPPAVRKIRRSDLAKLPRRFWFLANNSFLLHGYHNYNHLLLVEEDGHVWLGVPGVYDAREARAADLFGFPQFTRSYAPMLELTDEEQNNEADFGHWCRYLDSDSPAK